MSRRYRALRRRCSYVLSASLLAILVGGPALASSTTRKHLSPLEQGLAFYRGKQVTYIIPSAPGGSFDTIGRDLAPYMASYLHATFNIENVPQGNTIAGMDDLAAAPPNGLTVGEGNPPAVFLDAATNVSSVNFNLAREAFIGTAPANDDIFIASTSSPISSFAQLRSTPINFLGTGQGITDIMMRSVNAIFGLQFHFITGYATTAALIQGFDRGDGQMMSTNLTSVGPLIAGGKARAILHTAADPSSMTYANYLAGVPTIEKAAALYPPKSQRAKAMLATLEAINALSGILVMAPSATPNPQVTALRAAFAWSMRNPSLKQLFLSQGNNPNGPLSGPAAKQAFLEIQAKGQALQPALTGP